MFSTSMLSMRTPKSETGKEDEIGWVVGAEGTVIVDWLVGRDDRAWAMTMVDVLAICWSRSVDYNPAAMAIYGQSGRNSLAEENEKCTGVVVVYIYPSSQCASIESEVSVSEVVGR